MRFPLSCEIQKALGENNCVYCSLCLQEVRGRDPVTAPKSGATSYRSVTGIVTLIICRQSKGCNNDYSV